MKWIHLETYGPIVNGQTQKLGKIVEGGGENYRCLTRVIKRVKYALKQGQASFRFSHVRRQRNICKYLFYDVLKSLPISVSVGKSVLKCQANSQSLITSIFLL